MKKLILLLLALMTLSNHSIASEESELINGIVHDDYKITSILESTTNKRELNKLVRAILKNDYNTPFPESYSDPYEIGCITSSNSSLDGVLRSLYLSKTSEGRNATYHLDSVDKTLKTIEKRCSRLPFYKSLLSLLEKVDVAITDRTRNKETEGIIEHQKKITAEKEKVLAEEKLDLEATTKRNINFEKEKETRMKYQEKIDDARQKKEMQEVLIEEKKLQESVDRMEVELKKMEKERLIQKRKDKAIEKRKQIENRANEEQRADEIKEAKHRMRSAKCRPDGKALYFPIKTRKGEIMIEVSKAGIAFVDHEDEDDYIVAYRFDNSTSTYPIHRLNIDGVETVSKGLTAIVDSKTKMLMSRLTAGKVAKATVAMGNKDDYTDKKPPYKFEYVTFSIPLGDAMETFRACSGK